MKLLALDSSGLVASVALMDGDALVAEYSIRNKLTHSQTLLPMVAELLARSGVEKTDLDAVAVSAGPGSFTGLRIGASTAKGLAQALNIPVVSVSSLAGLACNLAGNAELICPIMDARRGQVYYGIYDAMSPNPAKLTSLAPDGADDISLVIDKLDAFLSESADKSVTYAADKLTATANISISEKSYSSVCFVGDGVPVFSEKISELMGDLAHFAPENLRYQCASSIAALGMHYLESNDSAHVMSAEKFTPEYLRKSQAERNLSKN